MRPVAAIRSTRRHGGHPQTGAAHVQLERRQQLQVPASVPFYEETTYWDPSWTFARGAIQTSNLGDLLTTGERVSGELLSPESSAQMVAIDLRGKTSTCRAARAHASTRSSPTPTVWAS